MSRANRDFYFFPCQIGVLSTDVSYRKSDTNCSRICVYARKKGAIRRRNSQLNELVWRAPSTRHKAYEFKIMEGGMCCEQTGKRLRHVKVAPLDQPSQSGSAKRSNGLRRFQTAQEGEGQEGDGRGKRRRRMEERKKPP